MNFIYLFIIIKVIILLSFSFIEASKKLSWAITSANKLKIEKLKKTCGNRRKCSIRFAFTSALSRDLFLSWVVLVSLLSMAYCSVITFIYLTTNIRILGLRSIKLLSHVFLSVNYLKLANYLWIDQNKNMFYFDELQHHSFSGDTLKMLPPRSDVLNTMVWSSNSLGKTHY